MIFHDIMVSHSLPVQQIVDAHSDKSLPGQCAMLPQVEEHPHQERNKVSVGSELNPRFHS